MMPDATLGRIQGDAHANVQQGYTNLINNISNNTNATLQTLQQWQNREATLAEAQRDRAWRTFLHKDAQDFNRQESHLARTHDLQRDANKMEHDIKLTDINHKNTLAQKEHEHGLNMQANAQKHKNDMAYLNRQYALALQNQAARFNAMLHATGQYKKDSEGKPLKINGYYVLDDSIAKVSK